MPVCEINFPGGGINDSMIATSANIASTKTVARRKLDVELAEAATAVAAITKLLTIFRASGTLIAAEAIIVVQATGADRTVTVDIKKSTGGGAFATIMTSTIDITNGTTILVPVAGVFSSTSVVDGDILEAVVTVAGAAGNQAKGLLLSLTYDEYPS